ncbi:hypothetical protein [Achromobacter kerstersii]|uniref:hypothetical protein n=1 Tax=Achromobacter kerstersii TaxID=1353890 RepID=UPI00313DF84E
MDISDEKKALILSRLVLAQSILEESDLLPGADAFIEGLHPRHEREALVVYLLLTCFDMLGQSQPHVPFDSWMRSKKTQHRDEIASALANASPEDTRDAVEATRLLIARHAELYGTGNAFRYGIDSLGQNAKDWLFSSISLGILPREAEKDPYTSYPTKPIEDKEVERGLKVRYLYKRRNEFTHQLVQRQYSSTPAMTMLAKQVMGEPTADAPPPASWLAYVSGSGVVVQCGGTHVERKASDYGLVSYSISDWPFVLFEVLYSAIGVQFSRSVIKLKFVILDSSRGADTGRTHVWPSVQFSELPATLDALGARMASWP